MQVLLKVIMGFLLGPCNMNSEYGKIFIMWLIKQGSAVLKNKHTVVKIKDFCYDFCSCTFRTLKNYINGYIKVFTMLKNGPLLM